MPLGYRLPQGGGFLEKARGMSADSLAAYRGQTPKQETVIEPPDKTTGGAMSAGAGGAMVGYQVGGPYGAAVVGALGVLSYMLS